MLGSAGLVLVVAGVILVVVLPVLVLLLLLLCLWCRSGAGLVLGAAGLVLGAAAAGGGGGVLVQGEVGSRNDADVELGLWGGVCNKKRPAWNCVFQVRDKKI